MNELSWLIYLADVAGAANFITSAAIVGALAYGVSEVVIMATKPTAGAAWDEAVREHHRYPSLYPKPEGSRPSEPDRSAAKAIRPALIALAVIITANVAIPSRETLYAVAASEMGERVIESETAGKAINALNAWLDRQIAPPASQ